MNLRLLEIFVAIVDAGGFTAAAARLRIAQPAVSAALRKLEDDLGAVLIVRPVRRLTLTAEGMAFLRHARGLLAQAAAARHEIAALRGAEAGRLSIGVPAMVATHILPPVIGRFLARRPRLRTTIIQAGAEEIAERVLRGELDLGIVADWRKPAGLTTRVLETHPMVACVAAGDSLAARERLGWSELIDRPLVLFPRGYYQRERLEDVAARAGRALTLAAEAEAVPIIVELVRAGLGVATLMGAATKNLAGIRVLTLPRDAVVPVAVCHRADGPGSAAAEAFLDFLERAYPGLASPGARPRVSRGR